MLSNIGVEIPREQALRIARRILEDAERERKQLSERETGLLDVIRELQARVAELQAVERKAIEQSEYIQSHGLTEYEMARLKARVAELERRLNPPCPDPSIDAFYLDANADFEVTYIDGKPNAKVVLE